MTSQSSAPSRSIPPLVIRSAIVASLGGLLFGFDTAVISGAEEKLTELYALSSTGEGMIVAIATIGTIVGAIVAGNLADQFGRKPILFWIGILFGVGALATALAPLPTLVTATDGTVSASSAFPITFFMIFRFLGGVGVGLSSVVAPIYTAEIAPARVRGRLVGLVQFNIVFGILLAYASNAVIREIAHEETAWRWMLGVMAVPAVFFLIFLATVPETPRWLLAHGHEERAVAISERLTSTQEESSEQIAEMKAQIAEDAAGGKVAFFTRRYRKVILMAFCIAMFNQLSGINAILYYAPKVMKLAGGAAVLGDAFPYIGSVIVGLMNLIATMAALTVIDKLGRRLPHLARLPVGNHVRLQGGCLRRKKRRSRVAHPPRPARLHRLPRLRSGIGHLGLHLRDLPEPRACPRPVPGLAHALGLRLHHHVRLPGPHG